MEQPLVCFQPTLFFPMLASGLGVEESLDLLRAFRDYRRGDQCADTTLREAALNRIRLLYSKMLSLSHAAQR